jgi:hypothetical protein
VRVVAVLALVVGLLIGASPVQADGWWQPHGTLSWQVQFDGRIDKMVAADAFDIDAFDSSARLVKALHAQGRRVVCYINAGAWENWRPDAGRYPSAVKGKPLAGWPGERWLDVRRIDGLGPILADRISMCAAKGFDGVEFDNVDGESNDTGFALTPHDQLTFDRWLADAAHAAGLAVGLKNTLSLAAQLQPKFDFAILEQCFQYHECNLVQPFLDADKPVLDVEYKLARTEFCTKAAALGVFAMRKRLELDAWRRPCHP